MTKAFLNWLNSLIAAGDIHPFYVSSEWRRLSAEVLQEQRHECQLCKVKGRYSKAELVHHVNHVKRRPDLALSKYYTGEDGSQQPNLVCVCKGCHENECHPERMRRRIICRFTTVERWD